jgi:thioredoxin reductase
LDSYEVVVVGGGAAGLNGALMLARSRRSVVVVDAGAPRNRPAAGVHGLLGHDGIPPGELIERGRAEVRRYGGHVVTGAVTTAARDGDRFVVALGDGRSTRARRLLVASGLVDELPDVPGVRERWGRDVVHCPYCHGWEVRDRAIGVLVTREPAVEFTLLWRQLSADVTVFCHTAQLDDAQRERLAARGVRVIDGSVAGLEVHDDRLTGVRLDDGRTIPCDALAVQPTFVARADLLAGMGLSTTEQRFGGQAAGAFVAADGTGATDVPGVWVAGNVTDLGAHLIGAAAAGVRAAAVINADLVTEDAARALEQHRAARVR